MEPWFETGVMVVFWGMWLALSGAGATCQRAQSIAKGGERRRRDTDDGVVWTRSLLSSKALGSASLVTDYGLC